MNNPKLIALEVTRSCPLHCKHCRAGAKNETFKDELTSDEIKAILTNIQGFANPIIILTGGEPLTRSDIFEIINYGIDLGLNIVLATCGQNFTRKIALKLKKSGIKRISFSIDGPDAKSHDQFRGAQSFDDIIKATKLCKELGIPFQINTTISKLNYQKIDEIYQLSNDLAAASFHPFFLVPTGRAKGMDEIKLSPKEYEEALMKVYSLNIPGKIFIKPTCAPQYHRIANKEGRGCLAGTGFAFISHRGVVQPCGFLDVDCGNLRENNGNFQDIWLNSKVLSDLRCFSKYTGRCGSCAYISSCGGCRARAHTESGSYLAEEPLCTFAPSPLRGEGRGEGEK